MTIRKIDTCIWNDPWVEQLSPIEKLSFVYLWANDYCSQSGIYQITPKRFEFDLGIKMNGPVESLHPKVEWMKAMNLIWVKGFFKWQCQSSKFAIGALNGLKQNREMLNKFINYNMETLENFRDKDGKVQSFIDMIF